ncbi:pantetheinase [Aplysia californica]|uniref:Pantetheinase n=1 Tax=Aplysia californica TaxID=6500 RepID=A0ABM1W2Q2_APLCA|nr:pantetheinase [Aplysia californica]
MMMFIPTPSCGSLCLTTFIVLLTGSVSQVTSRIDKFKAAVYEHAVVLPDTKVVVSRAEALAAMEMNLVTYWEQTAKAKEQGASIIVFPEDGLYGFSFTRDTVQPFLEDIPDPKAVTWSPCLDPERYPDTEVQRQLSCMARNNSIYLVADIGDKKPCNVTEDQKCPQDGRYQYNTAVAFDPDGYLVARYHKFKLFFEYQFDTPEPEPIYFDTPFGRFGLFVCFDVLFLEPAVTMVTQHNVTNIVFPTAWMDALPLLSAIGFHSSFARGLGVNFLSSNLHLPDRRFHGSGIYSPEGVKEFYYNSSHTSPGKLLVAELNVLLTRNPQGGVDVSELSSAASLDSQKTGGETANGSNAVVEDSGSSNSEEFQSLLFDDSFTFKALEEDSANVSVCQNKVCCHLSYSKENLGGASPDDLFALGAFDGLHTKEGQYYLQICALVKCSDAGDRKSCGNVTSVSDTIFHQLDLHGDFQTPFVYPQLILNSASSRDNLALAPQDSWSSQHGAMFLRPGLRDPVLSAALFGRAYDRDDGQAKCAGAKCGGVKGPGDSANPNVKGGYLTTFLTLTVLLFTLF